MLLIFVGGFGLIQRLLQLCQRDEKDDEDDDVEGGTPSANSMQAHELDIDQVEGSDYAHECQEKLRDPYPSLQRYRTPANGSQGSKGKTPAKTRDTDRDGCARNDREGAGEYTRTINHAIGRADKWNVFIVDGGEVYGDAYSHQ